MLDRRDSVTASRIIDQMPLAAFFEPENSNRPLLFGTGFVIFAIALHLKDIGYERTSTVNHEQV